MNEKNGKQDFYEPFEICRKSVRITSDLEGSHNVLVQIVVICTRPVLIYQWSMFKNLDTLKKVIERK
jgi:hypothetical protein